MTKGANYGWPLAEGVCDGCGFVNPIYTYAHTPPPAKAGSITGVMVYTDDICSARSTRTRSSSRTTRWAGSRNSPSTPPTPASSASRCSTMQAGTTVKLAQGPDGNIYQLNIFPGELSMIAPSGGNRAPSAVITATPSNGLSPLTLSFSSQGSSDPDPNTTLTYSWNFGDGTTSTVANPTIPTRSTVPTT